MSEQQIKIPHRRLLPSSCTLPRWHQKKSNLLAMPVIVLAPEFPLQNPDGSNFYLFSFFFVMVRSEWWWIGAQHRHLGQSCKRDFSWLLTKIWSYGEVPFHSSVPVCALLSCHGSDPSREIRRSSKWGLHNSSRNVIVILSEKKIYPQVKDVCFKMAVLNNFSNDKSNSRSVWWKKR